MDEEIELLYDFMQLTLAFLNIVYACSTKRNGDFYTDDERKINGFFLKTFNLIKNTDAIKFKKLTRMDVRTFNLLLSLLEEKLTKHSYRPAIEAECRLGMTLIYLAHGDSRNMLSITFRACPATVHRIIYDTCDTIWSELHWLYLAPPNVSELEETANKFYSMCGLPNCVGAIDGKHINIVCPPGAGSVYYNYKGHHSVVLMAACDAKYLFTYLDIGARGSESDGGVFSSSAFGQRLINNEIELPQDTPFPGSNTNFPYFFVADAAFPLKKNIMKPYPGTLLDDAKSKYNYKVSSARRFIENTFGIMSSRWRIMYKTMHCLPKNAVKITKAVVTLHNFVKLHDSSYCPPEYVDREENGTIVPGDWRSEVTPLPSHRIARGNNARREAFLLRDKLKDYLNNPN